MTFKLYYHTYPPRKLAFHCKLVSHIALTVELGFLSCTRLVGFIKHRIWASLGIWPLYSPNGPKVLFCGERGGGQFCDLQNIASCHIIPHNIGEQ